MTDHRNGPPERQVGPRPGHHSRTEDTDTNNHHVTGSPQSSPRTANRPGSALVWLPCTRTYPQDLRSQRDRRRDSAKRSVPLDCGCPTGPHRDPISCLRTSPPLTDHQLDSWRDAALHLLATTGRTPIVPLEVRRALWRRGDRRVAEWLHEASGGQIA